MYRKQDRQVLRFLQSPFQVQQMRMVAQHLAEQVVEGLEHPTTILAFVIEQSIFNGNFQQNNFRSLKFSSVNLKVLSKWNPNKLDHYIINFQSKTNQRMVAVLEVLAALVEVMSLVVVVSVRLLESVPSRKVKKTLNLIFGKISSR